MKRLLVAVSLAIAALSLAATPGGADPLTCGQVVTQNLNLTADVGPCPNDGIVVGADNVTVNLNGHLVSGGAADGRYGVWSKGHTGVVVTNGRVTGFDVGVVIEGGGRSTVQQINAYDNIGNFQRSNYGSGILVLASSDNVVQDNRAIHNGPLAGIEVAGVSLRNTVQRNDASYNDLLAPLGNSEDKGINVQGLSSVLVPSFTAVQYNRVVGNGNSGIFIGGRVDDSRVLNNVVQGNGLVAPGDEQPGSGIEMGPRGFRNLIQGNVVTDNGGSGLLIRPAVANPPVFLDNRIIGNTFLHNDALHSGNDWPASDIVPGSRFCYGELYVGNRFETASFIGSDCVH